MALFDGILGLDRILKRLGQVEKRLDALEGLIEEEYQPSEEFKKGILEFLSEPRTTAEVAKRFGRSRTWTSSVLNLMEKNGEVKEKGRKGRAVLYVRG